MFYSFSKPGTYHRNAGPGNQDRICVQQSGSKICAAVADGWGGSDLSQLGAEAAAQTAVEYLLTNFERLYSRSTANTIRYEVTVAVQVKLDQRAGELGTVRDALASTLLVLCYDTTDGRYISLHIGDGLSAWRDRTALGLLSAPTNGMTRQYTTLTSSPRCISMARVHRGQKPGVTFLLMTDGCTRELWDGAAFLEPLAGRLFRGDWSGFERLLEQKSPADDHSFIALGGG